MFDLLRMVQFNDNIKFRWRNLNTDDSMLINSHISLITKRFFRSFDRHSDNTATHSELSLNINNFSNKIVDVIRKSRQVIYKIVQVVQFPLIYFFVYALLWHQSIASGYSMTSRFAAILLLSSTTYILSTLIDTELGKFQISDICHFCILHLLVTSDYNWHRHQSIGTTTSFRRLSGIMETWSVAYVILTN